MGNKLNVIISKLRDKIGMAGSTLKLIAIVTMLIDHIAAVVLARIINALNLGTADNWLRALISTDAEGLYKIYCIMRGIGRIAFPIFCFLLVEGFLHTKNVWKYAFRLAIFAFISEIPFDLALQAKPFYFGYQNVLFTLLIGLLVMMGLKYISEKLKEKPPLITALFDVLTVIAGVLIAELLKTDYSGLGVMTIVIMYFLRKWHFASMLGGCTILSVCNNMELPAYFALIPALLYNGRRGLKLKYIFYLFYPVHLFILYLICFYMKLV